MRRSLFIASALGGGERKLTETLPGPLSWSPDGDTIAFIDSKAPEEPWSIWVLSLTTGEKRQITFPQRGWCGDAEPSFSPSGRYLAFVRRRELVRSVLYVTPFPSGEPKFVTDRDSPEAPCWTEDGREIVFATEPATGQSSLWRIYADGKRLRRIAARGEHIYRPSIGGHRLAYANTRGNSDIWRIEPGNPDGADPASSSLIAWSSNELESRMSPDGSRLAFVSDSSGNPEVWTCSPNGSNEFKVTEMKAGMTGSPDWSPDGKWITYDSTAAQNQDVYVIGADGGRARQLTTDTTDEIVPRWSRDGRWIYFGSNRNGSWQIWKIPSLGGSPVQITRNGGMSARESLDGLFLYYSGYFEFQKKGIWRVPTSGGPEAMVLDRASYEPLDWDVTDRGIFFIDPGPAATISWFSFVTRSVSSLGRVHGDPAFQPSTLSASADGKSFLCSGGIATSDIMLIDNFR
jgi:Tol biopolymer transport system component